MKSQIFTQGGGAGIGSRVIVLKNGVLQNVRAEVIRGSYDSGESLYLSIIDDSTEEALLPLTGYVDNEGVLHLSGRDFDDNKTYEFTIDNTDQSISLEEVDGVTIGGTTIPTEGGEVNVPEEQMTVSIVINALQNINHKWGSSYHAVYHGYSEALYPNYEILTSSDEKLTKEQASKYMKFMTGSGFVPVYNYDKPQYSYMIMENGSMWKVQYSESGEYDGLRLFNLPASTLNGMEQTAWGYDSGMGTTHILLAAYVMPTRLYIKSTNMNYYFNYNNNTIVNENNVAAGTFEGDSTSHAGQQLIILSFAGDIPQDTEGRDELEYIVHNGPYNGGIALNTYNLYHTVAGSKQYRHLIEIKAINPYETGGENYDNVSFSMITSSADPIASYSAFKTFVAADNNANKYVVMQNCMINVGSTNKTYGGIIAACQVSGSLLILAIISGETTLQANINPAYQVEFTDEVYEL